MTPAPSISHLSGSNAPVADLFRRRRLGRLLLPADVAELTAEDQPALELVASFVSDLAELPLPVWLTIARELAADGSLPVRQLAWTDVENAIADGGFGMVAWYVRDAIETAAFFASREKSCWSRQERCLFASVHGAAEAAALALLARQHISTQSLRALCRPFGRLFATGALLHPAEAD